MIEVREAVAEAAAAIAGLLGELGSPGSAAEIPARLTLLHRRGRVALLSALVVQTARRGEGVGRALVGMAERQAAVWGCETLELTSRDDRHLTHRFYAGLGFESGSRKFARPVAG